MSEQSNIRSLFANAKGLHRQLDSWQSTGELYQDHLRTAIATFEECRQLADSVSMFSPNETLDDLSSQNLQFLSIDYYLGELVLKNITPDRRRVLRSSQEALERYLNLLDDYSMLSASDKRLYERYTNNRDSFSLLSSSDASIRRDVKIARFKQEKNLKQKLEYLSQNPSALQNDDEALRELYLAELSLLTHQAFHSLDLIAQEIKIITLAPSPTPVDPAALAQDYRLRSGQTMESYSTRVDPSLSQLLRSGNAGPILSKEGKPLKPFTLLNSRQTVRDGVFRSGHNLPTMTIDEYLEEEKRRGGIIDGGGENSGNTPEINEDDHAELDQETMKAREWDEFKEENPRGSGNTLNRG